MPPRKSDTPRQYCGVMVSSTFTDLKKHRRALIRIIDGQTLKAVAMENDAASVLDIIDSSLRMVRDSSAYIVLVGRKYGQVPECPDRNPHALSITELEFNEAERLGRPILLFVMGDSHRLLEADVEADPAKKARLNTFRERAKRIQSDSKVHRVYTPFNSVKEFKKKAATSVAKLHQHLEQLQAVKHTWQPIEHNGTSSPPGPLTDHKKVVWDIVTEGSPYRGLKAMTDHDSALFFGREHQLKELARKLSGHKFVGVVGTSGAGKSSLVWAGLLPRLADIELKSWKPDRVTQWSWARMTPTQAILRDPLLILAGLLTKRIDWELPEILRALYERGQALHKLAEAINPAQPADAQWLLFVDQFEELFTLAESAKREAFINALDDLMATGQVRVIVTMRADFTGKCMASRDFGEKVAEWFTGGTFFLAAPNEEALREMVRGPAELANLVFENDETKGSLLDRIVDDTGLEPGNLALMAFGLEQLFSLRQGTVMTWNTYEAFGGIQGVIATKAETEFLALADRIAGDPQALLAEVFHELIEIDEYSGAAIRRRAPLTRWTRDSGAHEVIDSFLKARLLLTGSEPEPTLEPTLEVAHEALFRSWPLLAAWISGCRDHFLLRRHLQHDAKKWRDHGEPSESLWPDSLALKAAEMFEALRYTPTDIEERFLGPLKREDMLRLIQEAYTTHDVRASIGVRLAILGDNRPGVGVKDGLPDILWCPIAEGEVELEDQPGRFTVDAFHIAKYPITQAQYQLFLDAEDGFFSPGCWQSIPERYWKQPGRHVPSYGNHPAVNVAWMEAMAYCRWLSRRLGSPVRLPTEWEWQQAACNGNAENHYPWGRDWDSCRCNSYESQLNRTIAVGVYAQAWPENRPLDMVGNTWEWCINEYAKLLPITEIRWQGNVERTVRGGSWRFPSRDLHCGFRYRERADSRFFNLGFRVVLTGGNIAGVLSL